MEVQPKTPIGEVKFMQIPLDNSYTDTLRFENMPAQYLYFENFVGIKINGFTEVRTVNTDTIRVPVNSDTLAQYNYLMFKNANYSGKWFFAFVTNIEYVSPNMSLVTFEMDVLQTWQFDMLLRDCYVEREHTETDVVGDNIIDEGLEPGELMYKSFIPQYYSDKECTSITAGPIYNAIVVASTFELTDGFPAAEGKIYTGVYSGLHYSAFNAADPSSIDALSSLLASATEENKAEGIVSIFMMPWCFVSEGGNSDLDGEAKAVYRKFTFPQSIDDYTPRCYKLFTAPYSGLFITNNEGQDMTLRKEFFYNPGYGIFRLAADMSPASTIMMAPLDYGGVYNTGEPNFIYKIELGNFPQCAYTIDTYKAWLAQNLLPIMTGVAMNGVSGIAEVAASSGYNFGSVHPATVNSVVGYLSGLVQNVATAAVISTRPPAAQGAGAGSTTIANGCKRFDIYHYSIHKQRAKVIDDFFWAYGYAIKQIKTPNIDSRKYWNYVKTNGCKLGGTLPFNDAAKIKRIFDNGITFWHVNDNTVQIGNYSFDNSPDVKGFRENIMEVSENGEESQQGT